MLGVVGRSVGHWQTWTSFRRAPGLRAWTPCTAVAAPLQQGFGTWTGEGTQEDFMIKDTCITVDANDAILGHASKRDVHIFNAAQPGGILHRAFSVFLFDDQGRLLLQQRASSKITFPNVWTNTCCSHPLHGYSPSEVDTPEDIASGHVPGVKTAAQRKLAHELGIPAEQIDLGRMQYLTRLMYCAGDADDQGKATGWGEHEMDYILFLRACVTLNPNPEEVGDTRYVTSAELADMMRPESGLKWSPWFRIIAAHFLPAWWSDLDTVCSGSPRHQDFATIHSLGVDSQ